MPTVVKILVWMELVEVMEARALRRPKVYKNEFRWGSEVCWTYFWRFLEGQF